MKTSFHFLEKTPLPKLTTLTLVSAAMLAGNCWAGQSDSGPSATQMSTAPENATAVETYHMNATVTAIDPATRKVTLTASNGKQTTVKAGPEVRNFDQIHVGDQLKVTATQAVAISLRPPGTPPNAGEAAAVAVAPKGAKPGILMANTTEVTAKITSLDTQHRTATLQFPDGTSQTVKVGKDVDLTGVKTGDDVTGRVTDALAIRIERPQ